MRELQYRYKLKREGISDGCFGNLLYIMLNPSTADDKIDDATIGSCTRLAANNSYHSFWVGNLYGVRSKDPEFLCGLSTQDAIGLGNSDALEEMIELADDIVVAWGNPGFQGTPYIRELLKGFELLCIDINKDGSPAHPLYKKSTKKFKPWSFKENK